MEELLALRRYIEQQHYTEALDLIAEMEEMSREDKINKIYSFAEILLLQLIKQDAELGALSCQSLSIRAQRQRYIKSSTEIRHWRGPALSFQTQLPICRAQQQLRSDLGQGVRSTGCSHHH